MYARHVQVGTALSSMYTHESESISICKKFCFVECAFDAMNLQGVYLNRIKYRTISTAMYNNID